MFVRLPFEAVPGQLNDDVLTRLAITAGPIMGLAAFISILIYSRYRLTKARHQNILDTLRERAKSTQT